MLKVEIGGGPIPLAGYINVDCMDHPMVHHKVNIGTEKLPFGDGTVDEIYSSHCLEHITPGTEFIHALEEMYRVSKPDALWKIKVPYFNSHHTIANPFHINNIFNEYTFSYFSPTHKAQGNTLVRKGSISETWLLCTLEEVKIEYGYFDEYKFAESLPEEIQAKIRRNHINVVNEIRYTLRVVKPDFWTQERRRLGLE